MQRSLTRRVAAPAAFQFFFIAAVSMLKPGTNALMLGRFAASALPYLYVAAAIIASALALSPARRSRQPGVITLAGAVISGLLVLGVMAQINATPIAAYLFGEAFATQVSLAFWGAISGTFDTREARRAFSWINGVGMSGAIVGGFSAQQLASVFGASSLLVAAAVMLMLAALSWRFHQTPPLATVERVRSAVSWQAALNLPYAQLMGTITVGLAVLQQLIDFLFRHRVASQLAEADMARIFAAHQLWTGVFCVLFQFVIAESLLRKLGIIRYAALVPAALGVATLVAWFVPSVWSAWGLKVLEAAASWSVMPVAVQLLYAPLPDELRDTARRTVEGVIRKIGMAMGGVVLLGLPARAGVDGAFVAAALTCAGVGWALWRIRPRYVEAVQARVAGLDPEATFDGEERLLVEALGSSSAEQALRAAAVLHRADRLTDAHVKLLLEHPHEDVQERGVFYAVERTDRPPSVAAALEALVTSRHRRPRDAAVWALATIAPIRAQVVLPSLLDSKDVGVLAAAIGGLLALDGPSTARASERLDALLARGPAAPAPERREVARLLGRLKDPRRSKALVAYLEDSDPSVRRVAIEAAGVGGYLELGPRLLRFLSWRDDRAVTRKALASLGSEAVPLVAGAMDDRTRARSLRLQLPRLLRVIGTQEALDALLFSNAHDEPALHYRVGLSLARLHEAHPELRIDHARVMEALGRHRALGLSLVEPFLDARAALGDEALLTRVLGDRLDQSMEISFILLGLLHDPHSMRRAHALLTGADVHRRAWAVELLENVLSDGERELVWHHVERPHRLLRAGSTRRFAAHLEFLVDSDDYVLRLAARQVERRRGTRPTAPPEDAMQMSLVKKLFALEGVEVFAQSDVDDLAAIASVAKELTFSTGARIYAEGDPGDALYVIVEGNVEARRDGEIVLRMKAKESFGETSLFDGAPRINEVVAVSDCKMLVIDRRDFLDLVSDRPELLTGLFRVLSRQLKSMVVEVAATRRGTTGEIPLP